jgi:HEAT repeat protein
MLQLSRIFDRYKQSSRAVWRRCILILLLSLVLTFSWPLPAYPQVQDIEVRVVPLIEKLTDRDSRIRLRAADTLIDIGTPAIPALINALNATDTNLRWRAASVLGDLGPEAESAIPPLIAVLQDADPQVRLYATLALGNMGKAAKVAIPNLISALQDPDPYVRIYTPTALRKIGAHGEVTVLALTTILRDSNPRVRLNAAYALGALGREAESTIPNLVETLLDIQPYVRMGTVKSLASIAGAFQDRAKSLPSKKLSTLIATFDQVLSLLENPTQNFTTDDISRIRRPLNALKAEQENRLWDKILRSLQKHPWWGVVFLYLLVLPVLCAVLLQAAPLWILTINDVLKPYTDFAVPFLGINVPLRSVLLVGWFHYHPRVLDAWVAKHVSTAREQFSKKQTVRDRNYHIPLPVVLDGVTVPQLNPSVLAPALSAKRSRIVIFGEGGLGKTSLACQIGKWTMAEYESERLCSHLMLPILLEEAFLTGSNEMLLDAIRGQLQALIDAPEAINPTLLVRLLRQQRLLVIVDRFSEMPSQTRDTLQPDLPDFPINALVVTSRANESLGRSHRTTISPLRIESNNLSSFMEAYLMQRGQRDRLNDTEFFEACQRLSLMVGSRQITVLLAKLYAEQLIRNLQGPSNSNTLPDDVPSLMLGYLNELNRDITTDPLEDRIVHEDAKALAWACVKAQFFPSPIDRKEAIAVLTSLKREDPEGHLNYLETKLRVIETIGPGKNLIQFCLDPLAEYLAALRVVETVGLDKQQWQTIVLEPSHTLMRSQSIETIRGFLLASRDAYGARYSPEQISLYDRQILELLNPRTQANGLGENAIAGVADIG